MYFIIKENKIWKLLKYVLYLYVTEFVIFEKVLCYGKI